MTPVLIDAAFEFKSPEPQRCVMYLLVHCSGSRPRSIAAFSAGSPKASQPMGFSTCGCSQMFTIRGEFITFTWAVSTVHSPFPSDSAYEWKRMWRLERRAFAYFILTYRWIRANRSSNNLFRQIMLGCVSHVDPDGMKCSLLRAHLHYTLWLMYAVCNLTAAVI